MKGPVWTAYRMELLCCLPKDTSPQGRSTSFQFCSQQNKIGANSPLVTLDVPAAHSSCPREGFQPFLTPSQGTSPLMSHLTSRDSSSVKDRKLLAVMTSFPETSRLHTIQTKPVLCLSGSWYLHIFLNLFLPEGIGIGKKYFNLREKQQLQYLNFQTHQRSRVE